MAPFASLVREIADRHHLHKPIVEQPQYNMFARRRVETEYARLYEDIGLGTTIWSPFAADTTYFGPSQSPFMVNYRVDDLHALIAALREEGVQVEGEVQESEYGTFGWVMDPEGNKLELWQPPAGQ